MNILAIALVVISALLHALKNLFTKGSGDKQVFVWWNNVFSILFYAPIFFYFLFQKGFAELSDYYWCLVSGAIHFLYWIFLSKSYEKGDLSHVYPIMRSSPALVLLFAVLFLNEKVSAQGVMGILFVVIGVYIINMKGITPSELSKPIKSIIQDRATQYAFLTLLSVSLYSIVDKVAVGLIHPLLFAFYHIFFAMLLYTPYIAYIKKHEDMKKEWNSNKRIIILNGFLGILGYSLILVAFSIERVSYIVGLRQLSIVFAVFMGSRLLKEKHMAIRLTCATVIFVGAFFISVAK